MKRNYSWALVSITAGIQSLSRYCYHSVQGTFRSTVTYVHMKFKGEKGASAVWRRKAETKAKETLYIHHGKVRLGNKDKIFWLCHSRKTIFPLSKYLNLDNYSMLQDGILDRSTRFLCSNRSQLISAAVCSCVRACVCTRAIAAFVHSVSVSCVEGKRPPPHYQSFWRTRA